MDRCQFEEHQEKEGWSDVEEGQGEEQEEDKFTFGKMKRLPADWKQLLEKACKSCLSNYPKSEEDRSGIDGSTKGSNSRQIYSHYTRMGQRKILQKLVNSVS
ncbi:uncharacterized protein LOC135476142 [Liolophura sinensis]|uniref:uncharacterized protein LOC135476142 n=1 Tax=Liolophura sinensis TaxID=3198878 RepID=UPI00315966A4